MYQMVTGGTKVYVTLAYGGGSSGSVGTAVVSSVDGGTTWARITNTLNFHVVWVAGSTLYGEVIVPGTTALQTSTDNGASWQPLDLPHLPDGTSVNAENLGQLLPTADGTLFAMDPRNEVAYLHAGSWTLLPSAPAAFRGGLGARGFGGPLATVTVGRDGRPARVWFFSSLGTDSTMFPRLYWHDVQIV
jgi:hypothetical protein